ncbi:hypothetical protein ACIBJI_07950 [Nocardia sp. NPDC050408]|uniref:hypothetical protein n=1 Tax=Nocardia sp. NPDC050408 TaxID=3364319 RepID=UPI00378C646A
MIIKGRALAGVFTLAGIAPAVVLCVANGFVPGWSDISDPLGRPSQLSQDVIHSADQLDQITARLVPKHSELSQRAQVLNSLSINLAGLTDAAGHLPGDASRLNATTTGLAGAATPLPGLVGKVNGRVQQAIPQVNALSGGVATLADRLDALNNSMSTVQSSLSGLGPKSSSIASTLATIEEESAHVREFGPLLAVVGPPVNELGIPPLGFEAPPLPGLPK